MRIHGCSGKSHLSRPRRINPSAKKIDALDPADLCRRLELIIQEELRSRSCRRERAAKKARSTSYHHIPQVAAKDFAATTAQETIKEKDIHKLSRSVITSYKLGNKTTTSETSAIRAFHHRGFSDLRMENLANRNQFQRSRAFEIAALHDQARAMATGVPACDVKKSLADSCQGVQAWNSAETDKIYKDNISKFEVKPLFNPNDRHNWTQRDECPSGRRRGFGILIAPLICHRVDTR